MFPVLPPRQNFGQKTINPVPYVLGWGIPGSLFLVLGFLMFGTQVLFEQSSIPVDLEITQMTVKVVSENKITYVPEFTIMGGEYLGRRFTSEFFTNPPLYVVGDQTKGLFDPVSGEIQSEETSIRAKLLSVVCVVAGALAICAGIAFYIRDKNKLRWFS